MRHALEAGQAALRADAARSSRSFSDRLDDEYYEVLANGSWLESKVSEGGTASARVREQLERARAVLEEDEGLMAKRDARMIPLGYGKFVRADRIFALVPLEPGERGDGRRTYVHVDGLDRAARRLALRAGDPGRRRGRAHRGGRHPAAPPALGRRSGQHLLGPCAACA